MKTSQKFFFATLLIILFNFAQATIINFVCPQGNTIKRDATKHLYAEVDMLSPKDYVAFILKMYTPKKMKKPKGYIFNNVYWQRNNIFCFYKNAGDELILYYNHDVELAQCYIEGNDGKDNCVTSRKSCIVHCEVK